MNKKLLMSAVFGVVAIGAGAFALTNLGGDSSGQSPTARVAHASNERFGDGPHIFESEGGYFGNESESHPNTSSTPANSNDGPGTTATNVPQAPPTGGSQGTPDPEKPAGNGNPSDPSGPSGSSGDSGEEMPSDAPGQPDPAPKPPIIWNPDVIDAICEVLGCDDPVITVDPDLADGLCELLDCDGEPDPIKNPIHPCKLLGHCPPTVPGKVMAAERQ